MATIERYELGNGQTRYRVRYRTPVRGQTDKRGFRTKRDAEAFAVMVEAAMLRGEYVAESAGTATVADVYREWENTRARIKPSTRAKEDSAWRTRVKGRWGDVRISDIRTSAIRTWINELAESGLKAATIESALRVLRGTLDLAVEDRRLQHNPCERVRPPRRVHVRRGYLTHDQVTALATSIVSPQSPRADAQPIYGTIVLLLAYTGLRWGEMAALEVGDINLTRRRIDIRRAVAEVHGKLLTSTPKNHERRSVPYPEFLHDAIRRAIEGKQQEDLVFTGPQGGALRVSDFRPRFFMPAVARCQQADPTFPRVSPHDLRHTAASLAISAGANVKAVQTMLGHKSAAMTLDTYADLFPDDLDDVASALHRAATRTEPRRPLVRTRRSASRGRSDGLSLF